MFSLFELQKLWARRSGTVCMLLLERLGIPELSPKPQLDLTFLSMCGKGHLPFLRECLLSLYHSWPALPKLQIIADGTIAPEALEAAFEWWPNVKAFRSWEYSVKHHQQYDRRSLVEFSQYHMMGRKLAVILEYGDRGPTLWCDSDILWFQELKTLPSNQGDRAAVQLKVAEDCQQCYDNDLLQQGLAHLDHPPFFNAGLVFLQGNLLEACDLEHFVDLAVARKESQNQNWFTEQTLFAAAAHQLGKQYWTRQEVAIFLEDQLSWLFPTYFHQNWVARHYTTPVRHLFWRDALALRLWGHQHVA